ncbi:phospholipase A [Pseudoalteromonas tunicata]|uniref:Phospholipase A1 n=1 Tax=Pseudoalteromonas tunicata D2 TaxID=87626 RepID=A4C7U7_9GAMM|nr:phospholipase A [Pseudoalteromonas tunicata]ATC93168.1 phospholipase A1 [Pseudoalteromonas tunicata]AXT32237.1 phospholipase [Pseudoalteromonas tunicata]EAR28662.1 putative outer membrane phospholipase A precursor [Pseudoalteromonas tunicata D2]
MRYVICLVALISFFTNASESDPISNPEVELVKQCILGELLSGNDERTIGQIKQNCAKPDSNTNISQLDKRMAREHYSQDNRNVITPHKRNYLLPVTYMSNPNSSPFNHYDQLTQNDKDEPLDNFEAKYQLSIKVPLFNNFSDKDQAVYLGFTLESYWQVFNKEISSPFRETNYQPEIFWINFLDPEHVLWGDEMAFILGFEHQSNGRSQPNSRSWNRIYADFIWENRGFVFSLKPWFRIPENHKTDALDPKGDDNPDIYKYMGYFEFSGAYRYQEHEFSFMSRNNFNAQNRGAIQLDWSFPLWGRLRGYTQYFNGYGESLIDYNANIQRFGIGILLSDLL